MLQLNLIRHAKTEPQSKSGRDFDRELLPKGQKQSALLASFLNESAANLGDIICSTAVRTTQTSRILFPERTQGIVFLKALYLAEAEQIKQLIAAQTNSTLTIIGHNEGLSDLASLLSGEQIHLQTAGFIQLQFELEDWNQLIQGTGIITIRFRPEVAV
jgi:phosphohistidine phosphatase